MKRLDRSISQLYERNHQRFVYYCADGEYCIVAGEEGVTEEWIQLLKILHRLERNDVRREQQNISLDAVDQLVGDKSLCFTLDLRPLEDRYIEREMLLILNNALQKLPDHHRRLFIDVRLKGRSISSLARMEGVHESTLRERLWRIEKNLRKYIADTPE